MQQIVTLSLCLIFCMTHPVIGQNNIWAEKLEAVELDNLKILEDSKANLFVAGTFVDSLRLAGVDKYIEALGENNFFIAKYCPNREWLGFVHFYSDHEFNQNLVRLLEVDPFDNIYLTGSFYRDVVNTAGDTLMFVLGSVDNYIAKFDTDLNLQWIHPYGGGNNTDFIADVHPMENGGFALSGMMTRTFDFDLSDSITNNITGNNGGSPYVAVYQSDKSLAWVNVLPSKGNDAILRSVSNQTGEIYGLGYISDTLILEADQDTSLFNSIGENDLLLIKWGKNGAIRWAKTMGGSGKEYISDLKIDESGNIYFLAQFTSPVFYYDQDSLSLESFQDLIFAKVDTSGNVLWINQIPKSSLGSAEQKLFIQQSQIHITGDYAPNMVLNTRDEPIDYNLTSSGDFAATYDLDGNMLKVSPISGTLMRMKNDIRLNEQARWTACAPLNTTLTFNPLPGGTLASGNMNSWIIATYCTPRYDDLATAFECQNEHILVRLDNRIDSSLLYFPDTETIQPGIDSIKVPGSQEPFTLVMYDGSGCPDYQTIDVSEIDCFTTKISNEKDFDLTMFPNPVHDFLYLTWSNQVDVSDISIYNIHGNKRKQVYIQPGANRYTINLRDLTPGAYLIHVSGNGFSKTGSFIK